MRESEKVNDGGDATVTAREKGKGIVGMKMTALQVNDGGEAKAVATEKGKETDESKERMGYEGSKENDGNGSDGEWKLVHWETDAFYSDWVDWRSTLFLLHYFC